MTGCLRLRTADAERRLPRLPPPPSAPAATYRYLPCRAPPLHYSTPFRPFPFTYAAFLPVHGFVDWLFHCAIMCGCAGSLNCWIRFSFWVYRTPATTTAACLLRQILRFPVPDAVLDLTGDGAIEWFSMVLTPVANGRGWLVRSGDISLLAGYMLPRVCRFAGDGCVAAANTCTITPQPHCRTYARAPSDRTDHVPTNRSPCH